MAGINKLGDALSYVLGACVHGGAEGGGVKSGASAAHRAGFTGRGYGWYTMECLGRRPPRPQRTLVGSDISWLFVLINAIDRKAHLWTGYHLLVPYSWRGMQKRAKAVRAAPELNSETDETLHGVALFLGDMDKSVVGVSATGRLLINNLVLGMLDLRCACLGRGVGVEGTCAQRGRVIVPYGASGGAGGLTTPSRPQEPVDGGRGVTQKHGPAVHYAAPRDHAGAARVPLSFARAMFSEPRQGFRGAGATLTRCVCGGRGAGAHGARGRTCPPANARSLCGGPS